MIADDHPGLRPPAAPRGGPGPSRPPAAGTGFAHVCASAPTGAAGSPVPIPTPGGPVPVGGSRTVFVVLVAADVHGFKVYSVASNFLRTCHVAAQAGAQVPANARPRPGSRVLSGPAGTVVSKHPPGRSRPLSGVQCPGHGSRDEAWATEPRALKLTVIGTYQQLRFCPLPLQKKEHLSSRNWKVIWARGVRAAHSFHRL